MKQIHRITLTAEDLRAAVAEYLSTHGGDCVPDASRWRLLTQQTFTNAPRPDVAGELTDWETDVLVIEW